MTDETLRVGEPKKKPSTFKILIGTIGALFAVSHIGLIGYVIRQPEEPSVPQVPTINIPRGDYSSYTIEAGKEGYRIQYKANDPAILESEKSLRLNQHKKGFFGGCLLYTSPSPRDKRQSRMPSSA